MGRFPETYNDPKFLVTLAISAESIPSRPQFSSAFVAFLNSKVIPFAIFVLVRFAIFGCKFLPRFLLNYFYCKIAMKIW